MYLDKYLMAAVCCGLAAYLPINSYADDALEEVIVTATKRAESVQEVPIAVSAISGELLENAGVADIRQLVGLSPSLYVSSSQSETAGAAARIRGIGTTGDNPGLESAVGIFIDGVYRSRNTVGLTELGQIERIEVLRGPQGTLFGRNTSAGLIHVITKGPSFETSGYGEITGGNFDLLKLKAGFSGALVEDQLAARLDIAYQTRDGFFDDISTGTDYNDRDRTLLRGQFKFQPSDQLSIRAIIDYAERDETCCAASTLIQGPTSPVVQLLGGQFSGGDVFDRQSATSVGRNFGQAVDEAGISIEVNWSGENFDIASITAYRDWEATRSQDADFTSLDIVYRPDEAFSQEIDIFTQEFRVNGQAGKLNWLAGVFYSNENIIYRDAVQVGADYQAYANTILAGQGLPALSALPIPILLPEGSGMDGDVTDQNAEAIAVFTHNIYDVNDAVSLTLGLRYTSEDKELSIRSVTNSSSCSTMAANFMLLPPLPQAAQQLYSGLTCSFFLNNLLDTDASDTRNEEEWSGTLGASWQVNESLMTYANYSVGYKAGGYNLDRAGLGIDPANPFSPISAASLNFDPETVNAYELGLKSSFAAGRGIFNVALFYMDFEDFQLNSFNGINFLVTNLNEVISSGIELETSYKATSNLTFHAGLTYNEAEYADQVIDSNGVVQTNLAGQQLTNAPELSFSGSGSYEFELPNSNLAARAHLDFRWTDETNTGSDLDPEKIQDSYFVVNGRVGIGALDDRWRLDLWAHNLFDEEYFQVIIDSPIQTGSFTAFLAEPRTWGVTLSGRF